MNIDSKYFDIALENNFFYVTENINNPTKQSIIETLKRIKYVLNNNLEYNFEHKNNSLDFYKKDSKDVLQLISSNNYEMYIKCVNKNKLKNSNKIQSIYSEIQSYFSFSYFLQLPNELIYEVVKRLNISEMCSFARLNRFCYEHAQMGLAQYAKKFGYNDEIDHQPVAYLNRFFDEFFDFYQNSFEEKSLNVKKIIVYEKSKEKFFTNHEGVISKKNWINKKIANYTRKNKVCVEKTLNNLLNLKVEQGIKFLNHYQLYLPKYPNLRKFFVNFIRHKSFYLGINQLSFRDDLSPLHLATIHQQGEIVKVLLEKNIDPNAANSLGITALHVVDDEFIAKMLIDCGARVNQRSAKGFTPLHLAAYEGRFSIVRVLLENGSDVTLLDNFGKTALHHVVLKGFNKTSQKIDLEIIQLLLKYNAEIDAEDNMGQTALHIATINSNLEVVKILLANGADANIQNVRCVTPLQSLAARKPIFNSKVRFKNTKDIEIVKLLIKNGALVNATDPNGQTALHIAMRNGDKKIVLALLNQKADIKIRDHEGQTAYDIAVLNNHRKIKWLIQKRNVIEDIKVTMNGKR